MKKESIPSYTKDDFGAISYYTNWYEDDKKNVFIFNKTNLHIPSKHINKCPSQFNLVNLTEKTLYGIQFVEIVWNVKKFNYDYSVLYDKNYSILIPVEVLNTEMNKEYINKTHNH